MPRPSLTKRDESFCLDIVQDTVLKLVRFIRPVDEMHTLDAFIDRVTHTTAMDRLRKEARQRRTHLATDEPQDTTDRIEWIRAQLEELGESDRLLIRLRFGSSR